MRVRNSLRLAGLLRSMARGLAARRARFTGTSSFMAHPIRCYFRTVFSCDRYLAIFMPSCGINCLDATGDDKCKIFRLCCAIYCLERPDCPRRCDVGKCKISRHGSVRQLSMRDVSEIVGSLMLALVSDPQRRHSL